MIFVFASSVAFFVTFFTLPIIIRIFKTLNILDQPGVRKVHFESKPSMGGFSILLGLLFTLLFFGTLHEIATHKFVLAGVMLMFVLGLRDDVASLYADQKFVFQILAALLVAYFGDLRLTGFYGFFGIDQFPFWVSVSLTVFFIVAITNAFNLIDGIDGLAGTLIFFISLMFGIWFMYHGDYLFSIIAFAVVGALSAFLIFNWFPSRIFMGDTGSISLGFLISIFAIKFIHESSFLTSQSPYYFTNYIPMTLALLSIPIYDTSRVFFIRILSGRSPFTPDKNHIHHVLLRQGFNHGQAALFLLGANILIVILAFSLQGFSQLATIILMGVILFGIGALLDFRVISLNKAKSQSSVSI